MSQFEHLSQDEQLVVKLLLESGRSKSEIADFLGVDESVVSQRAKQAFAVLSQSSGEAAQPPVEQPIKEEIAEKVRSDRTTDSRELPISRRGGAILLAAVAVLAGALILIFQAGDDSDKSAAKPSTTNTTATTSDTTPDVLATVKLTAPNGKSKPVGAAQIVKSGQRTGIVLAAQKVPKSGSRDAYAVWLTGESISPKRLGFAQPVKSNGNLSGVAELPKDYTKYTKVVVSKETQQQPTAPNNTVLSGSL